MEMSLNLPRNYVEIEEEEMMYLDGGLYMSNNTLKSWVITLAGYGGAGTAAITTGIKSASVWMTGKLAAILGPVGAVIGGALSVWIWGQAGKIAERTVSAIARGKGCDFYISWSWVVIPGISGTIR